MSAASATKVSSDTTNQPEGKGPRRHTVRRLVGTALRRVVVAVLLFIVVGPMVWLLLSSFKTQPEFLGDPFWSLPNQLNLDNYVEAMTSGGLGGYIMNSVITVFPSLALMTLLGTAAGFALEMMVFKGRRTTLLLFLAGLMVPIQMILLPLFTMYFRSGLTGSLWPLFITYTAIGLPLTVFLMATYFRAIPKETLEAAAVDGASIYRIFWSVALPMVRNGVFTIALVQFFFIWNDLLVALTFTTSSELHTVQVGLLNFTGQYGAVDYGPTFAAICINVFGTFALYLALNQKIMRGLTAGSVKG